MLRLAANLPDPVIGLAPSSDRLFHLALEVLPVLVVQVLAGLHVEIDRVEECSPDVVLMLLEGRVADPDRFRSFVPGQVIERGLGEPFLPADPVHDLERAAVSDPVLHEGEEVVRLGVEAERVEAPERERGVADPAVAVVPVAMAADQLGQRGRGRGEERARRGIGQPLQHEGAPLQGAAPRMIGERALGEPVPPEVLRAIQPLDRLVDVTGRRRVGVRPGEGDVGPIALLHRRVGDRRSSLEPEPEARPEAEDGIGLAAAADRFAVPVGGELPAGIRPVVVEARFAVQRGVDLAVHAFEDPNEHVLCLEVARRSDVRLVAGLGLVPGADGQGVAHHQPARLRLPRGLEDVGPREVAAPRRDDPADRSHTERSGGSVEQGAEDARTV